MGKYVELCNTCQYNRSYGEACMNCSYGDNYQEDTDEYIKSFDNIFRGLKDSNRAIVLKEVFGIEKVIFNAPATVVIWKDGTKTVVKSGDYDVFVPEKGLAMAIAKKALGNKGNYYEVFKKWLPEETTNTDRGKSIEPIVKNVKATNIGEDGLLLEGELTKTGEKFFEKVSPEKVDEKLTKFEVVHDADSLKVTAETVTERKI